MKCAILFRSNTHSLAFAYYLFRTFNTESPVRPVIVNVACLSNLRKVTAVIVFGTHSIAAIPLCLAFLTFIHRISP